jgi:ferric-dicitrate binding protein FerR (iron transport regulator)
MRTPDERGGRRTADALAEMVRATVRPPTKAQLDVGLDRLRARLDVAPARHRSRWAVLRWSGAGLLTAAVVVLVVGFIHRGRSFVGTPLAPALSYRVQGASVVEGDYLRESGQAGIDIFFAEGTHFALTPGTRSRLRAVDATGARLAIENGTGSFQVTPSSTGHWQVEAGPFVVTVKGTVFTVSWDAVTEKLKVTLQRGRVTVSGPVSGEIALRPGQRLAIDLPKGEAIISAQNPADDEVRAGPPPPSHGGAAATPRVASTGGKSSGRLEGDRGWAEALAAGHLDAILAEAERAGLGSTLDRAPSEDLLALADAARYRRRVDVARAALLAQRRRFPDSPRAPEAIFLLGRVEEGTDGGLAPAIQWYDEYLRRAPAGTYASEALGRKMTLASKLSGAAAARTLASEYLRRFPDGTYAGAARAFLRAP